MKPTFMAPRSVLETKPAHGQPCNRCGLCCYATICDLGQSVFHRKAGPCPALEGSFGNASCGLTQHGPTKYRAAAGLLIGAGTGCDARFNGEPAHAAFYDALRRWDEEHASELRDARKLWGMPPNATMETKMGAVDFSHFAKGKTAQEAFIAARDQAHYDHGHAGYTGTIAEKHSFVMIPFQPPEPEQNADPQAILKRRRAMAEDFAYTLIDDDDRRIVDKWGPAGCIDLGGGEYLFFGWASS